jgi:hypothetical protein
VYCYSPKKEAWPRFVHNRLNCLQTRFNLSFASQLGRRAGRRRRGDGNSSLKVQNVDADSSVTFTEIGSPIRLPETIGHQGKH